MATVLDIGEGVYTSGKSYSKFYIHLCSLFQILSKLILNRKKFSLISSYQKREEVINQMKSPEVPAFVKGFLPPVEHLDEMFTNSFENRFPIFILGF